MDEDVLQEIVNRTAAKQDHPYLILTGAFLARFASVEMMLTALLAVLLQLGDLTAFQIITRGMDARVKIDRLKQLAKHRNGKIGATLKERLDYFENSMIPVRNELAHGALWGNQKERGRWHVITIDSFQFPFTDDVLDNTAKSYTAGDLSARATWCDLFFKELAQAFDHARRGEVLEIDTPAIKVPKGTPQHPPKQRAKPPRAPGTKA